jgi:hypothetical protein
VQQQRLESTPNLSATKVPTFSKYAFAPIHRTSQFDAYSSKDLALKAEISNDHFVRTTDVEHKDAVQYAWVRENGMF